MAEDAELSWVPCALVVGSRAESVAESVVVVFVNPREADEFAVRHGLDARVVPMHFAVEMDRKRPGGGRVTQ